MVGGGEIIPESLGQPATRCSKIADFERIFASALTVTSNEKSSITLIGSPLHAFQA